MGTNHIMIDLETLGTRADSVIMSIGAVKFDPDSDEIEDDMFYASISIESNCIAGRHIDESTILWWMKQSAEAQGVFHEPKFDLQTALTEFSDWVGNADYQIWSNGADFDIPMLAHAYATNHMAAPWKFYNSNCFRTMKKLPFAKTAPKVVNELKHNALTDALTQARQLQVFYKVMKGAV